MHVRIRMFGKPDTVVAVQSRLSKIEELRKKIKEKFKVESALQLLLYGGKVLENGYTFHDYNIKINDVVQLMVTTVPKNNNESSDCKDSQKNSESEKEEEEEEDEYKDAKSNYYETNDLIDVRDAETGAWFEGKIVRIVLNPEHSTINNEDNRNIEGSSNEKGHSSESVDENVLFKVHLENEDVDDIYCSFKDMRPRARRIVDELVIGHTVMINHNIDHPLEKGYWYDFKVDQIEKGKKGKQDLLGTLYLGKQAIPQDNTTVTVHDNIYFIEEPKLLSERTDEERKLMKSAPEQRSKMIKCLKCRDINDKPCSECGCNICSGKDDLDSILLCDECDLGFHMACLSPPLTEVPSGDWYCPGCKRDPNEVIAPGGSKQPKKASTTNTSRDWGRGMACVGKTKDSAMPMNYFGPIPGIEVGMTWRFRFQASETGVHRPMVAGIHGRSKEGAYSIVLSGGYEDDVDNGEEFLYTGSGGRNLSGNKRTAQQSSDQTLTMLNKALAMNCPVKLNEAGGDAGDEWRRGRPVRVLRSYKMRKHSKYAPSEGIRYDGIYKVVKYYPEKGLSGFHVWKYQLRRDDPSSAPWDPDAKKFPIIYPEGYLEAEKEMNPNKAILNASKNKQGNSKSNKNDKKVTASSKKTKTAKNGSMKTSARKNKNDEVIDSNNETSGEDSESFSDSDDKENSIEQNCTTSKPLKRKGGSVEKMSDSKVISPKRKKLDIDNKINDNVKPNQDVDEHHLKLSDEVMKFIEEDTRNETKWKSALLNCDSKTNQEFIEHVTEVFQCIICHSIAKDPVTTPCLHNFCEKCINRLFKVDEVQMCPCCRKELHSDVVKKNEALRTALRTILPGYDAKNL